MSEYVQIDRKVFFAAADRNKDVILNQLKPYLAQSRLVLEVGSGSGQHIQHFSSHYPNVVFQPTEYDTALLPSIEAYSQDLIHRGHHIKTPLELDATNSSHWKTVHQAGLDEEFTATEGESGCYDLVLTTNVFHISPWIVGESIVRGAGKVLKTGGHLITYGPFKRNGEFNTESNREFDQTLRSRDPSWGVRDMEAIKAVAADKEVGLRLEKIIDMPSNNYLLVFQKYQHEL
ncbi:hypothetical protein BGZ83_008019 [Gryganskiella cystojenkinii]|nr:hypothetical protein BGZ83_008019 [Gryganskiella cystojenkinii]